MTVKSFKFSKILRPNTCIGLMDRGTFMISNFFKCPNFSDVRCEKDPVLWLICSFCVCMHFFFKEIMLSLPTMIVRQ